MKIVVFGDQGRVGVPDGDQVVDLNRADAGLPARLDQIRSRSPWPNTAWTSIVVGAVNDVVESTSPRIGTLRNRMVAA